MDWFYANGDSRHGPVPEDALDGLVARGEIGADTLVWRAGMEDWEPAHRHVAGVPPPLAGARRAPPRIPGSAGDYRRESGMKDAAQKFFANYATFSGRSNRGEFWYWALDGLLMSILLGGLDGLLFGGMMHSDMGNGGGPLSGLWGLVTLVPGLALGVRRLHDIDRTGWWLLLWLVPVVGWIVLLVWFAQKPDEGPNRFG